MNMRNRHPHSESGQAIVLIALVIVGLIAITGLVVDGGTAFANRRQTQNAADSAALAASLAKARGTGYQSAALESARQNGYTNDGTNDEVHVYNPPVNGPYAGNREYIQVVITSHSRTYFGPVIGIRQITNTAEAVVRTKPA